VISSSRAKDGHRDLVSGVHAEIRDLIVCGRLAPGARIVEATVARRMGVSRTPVRAALLRLQQEGYVVGAIRAHRARPMVAALTLEDARELFTIQGEIEGVAAERAALLPAAQRRALVAELRRLNDEYLAAARDPHPALDTLFSVNAQFHQTLFAAGAGPRLEALHAAIEPQTERYIRVYHRGKLDAIHPAVKEHRIIISAVRARAAAAAQSAVRSHWRNVVTRLERWIDLRGDIGAPDSWTAARPAVARRGQRGSLL
jgi:DNA-binding GntR family transcriptional regulator